MRQDQFEKLQLLEVSLVDVFLVEAQPENWPGHGLAPSALDQQSRGDRYWCKKNAVATLSLAQRIASLVGQVQARGTGTSPPAASSDEQDAASDLDRDIAAAEKEAAQLLKKMQDPAAKAAWDARTHGKA